MHKFDFNFTLFFTSVLLTSPMAVHFVQVDGFVCFLLRLYAHKQDTTKLVFSDNQESSLQYASLCCFTDNRPYLLSLNQKQN